MPDQPTSWIGYVSVPSVNKAVDKVRGAGGNVIIDYMRAGEMGAFGVCLDPQAAPFAVWESFAPPPAAKRVAKKAAKKKVVKKAAKKKVAKKAAKRRR